MFTSRLMAALVALCYVPMATAAAVKFNAFGSGVAGMITQGDATVDTGTTACPCYFVDWYNGHLYSKRRLQTDPESRLGGQLDLKLTDALTGVAQVVARTGSSKLSLEWAYLSYEVIANLTIDVGQKRLPIFYYSEFQDVGYAYIWLRPPGELYGWDINNFIGSSVRYRFSLGDWAFKSSVFFGNAETKDSGYFGSWMTESVTVQWNNIRGIDTEVSHGWLTARAVYIRSSNRYDLGDGWGDYNFNTGATTFQEISGLAINMTFGPLLFLSETNLIRHSSPLLDLRSLSYSLGAGYTVGDLTPFINYSDYNEFSNDHENYSPSRYDNWSATLRYDFARGHDMKLQYNWLREMSPIPFAGSTQLLSLSYDFSL